ncbi:hypothetical protein EB169_11840 [archaeon]|nr:hypothetical protein [archaeon]
MSIAGYVPSKKPVINFDFVNGEFHGGPIYGYSDTTATHVNKNGEVRKIDYWNSDGAGSTAGRLHQSFVGGHRIDYDPYTGEINPYYEELTGKKHPFLMTKEENKIKKLFKKIFNRV